MRRYSFTLDHLLDLRTPRHDKRERVNTTLKPLTSETHMPVDGAFPQMISVPSVLCYSYGNSQDVELLLLAPVVQDHVTYLCNTLEPSFNS